MLTQFLIWLLLLFGFGTTTIGDTQSVGSMDEPEKCLSGIGAVRKYNLLIQIKSGDDKKHIIVCLIIENDITNN